MSVRERYGLNQSSNKTRDVSYSHIEQRWSTGVTEATVVGGENQTAVRLSHANEWSAFNF